MCSSHSNSVSRVSGAKTTASSLADSHNHDVAVVGAGIGGLAAAALLARKGARVLVVESHDRPGGSCTSWLRKVRLVNRRAKLTPDRRPMLTPLSREVFGL